MAKLTTKNITRHKRRTRRAWRNGIQDEKVREQIGKAEDNGLSQIIFFLVAAFFAGILIYAGVTIIISTFFS